jgi:hypothetical protein
MAMIPFSSTWDVNDVLVIMSTVGATTAGATTTAAASAATITTTIGTVSDWRQYVPLGVSIAVIMDILLGSPFANAIVSRMRPTTTKTTMDPEIDDASDLSRPRRQQQQQQQSKERIDSQKVAQDAIQRAQYTLELRSFLDAQRDPVVELQRRMEEQTRQLELNQAQLQSQIIKERSNGMNSDNDKK